MFPNTGRTVTLFFSQLLPTSLGDWISWLVSHLTTLVTQLHEWMSSALRIAGFSPALTDFGSIAAIVFLACGLFAGLSVLSGYVLRGLGLRGAWLSVCFLPLVAVRLFEGLIAGRFHTRMTWMWELLGVVTCSCTATLATVGYLLCGAMVLAQTLFGLASLIDRTPAPPAHDSPIRMADRLAAVQPLSEDVGGTPSRGTVGTKLEALGETLVSIALSPAAFAIVLTYLGGSLFLYSRFGASAGIRSTDRDDLSASMLDLLEAPEKHLLPSQHQVFSEIVRRVELQRGKENSLVIGIDGDWGAGKTRVIDALDQRYTPLAKVAWELFKRKLRSEAERWNSPSLFWDLLDPETVCQLRSGNAPDTRPDEAHRHALVQNDEVVFVPLTVWKYSSERDLHWALLESLLDHPLSPPGWRVPFLAVRTTNLFRYPFVLMFVYAIRAFGQVFGADRVSLPGGMSFTLNLSGMLWQRQLDLVLDSLREANRTVVWSLDEIDRTSPEMAQVALTLCRRFLVQPGTVILIPYNAPQLHFKAFNPLNTVLPDLQSNTQAILWEHLEDSLRRRVLGPTTAQWLKLAATPLGVPSDGEPSAANAATAEAKDRRQDRGHGWRLANLLPSNITVGAGEKLVALAASEPTNSIHRQVTWELLVDHFNRDFADRARREFLFEEKFLRQARIRLRRLQAEDVAMLVCCPAFKEIHDVIAELFLSVRGKLDTCSEDLRRAVRASISVLNSDQRPLGDFPRPVLRHFLDELREKLISVLVEARRDMSRDSGAPAETATARDTWLERIWKNLDHDAVMADGEVSKDATTASNDTNGLDVTDLLIGLIALLTTVAYVRSGNRLLSERLDG